MKELKTNKLFDGLAEEDFQHLEGFVRIRDIPPKTVLMEEGQPGDTLFLLLSGRVRVTRTTKEGQELLLTERQDGDFFGEMALIEDAPRSARVVTTEPCTVGTIGKANFADMMQQHPVIALNIVKAISSRLRQSNDQLLHDFLERDRLQHRQLERFHALFELSHQVAAASHWTVLFPAVPATVRRALPGAEAVLFAADEQNGEFFSELSSGAEPQRVSLPLGETQKAVTSANAAALEKLAVPFVPALRGRQLYSYRLFDGDRSTGLLVVALPPGHALAEQDFAFIGTLTSYLEVVLRNVHLQARMLTVEKLSAVGRASSSFLHDCKNLIAVIRNYAKLSLQSDQAPERNEPVEQILKTADLMMRMSREVLWYAQGQLRLRRETVAVEQWLDTVASLARDDIQRRSIILRVSTPGPIEASFDVDKMTRAVYNLLINACQAIEHDHGEITLQAEADEQLEIVVADNGAGIPPEVLPRVFEPFVTTRSEGNGLGLPLVKTIVDAHGGEVRVESKAGEGSRFIVTLPIP